MEKDIEILESFIKQLEEFEDEEELKHAIENLINRVKELENLCNRNEAILRFMETQHKIDIDNHVNDTIEIATNNHFRDLENYIPKSKIKEKIEELEDGTYYQKKFARKVLLDLLKEE